MTCRATTSAQTCTSSRQTGARFTSDAENRLVQWVSADGATTVNYGYDGEGQRFELQVVSGSTTTGLGLLWSGALVLTARPQADKLGLCTSSPNNG